MSTSRLSQFSFDLILNTFPQTKKIWIACSGGMDSSVLLHLVFSHREKIGKSFGVIYVDHGIQRQSDEWGDFCRSQCDYYGLSFTQININEKVPKCSSVEAWARKKRYELIAQVMNKGDLLFTAHHQDDQVETFFLQALRGAGPRGLSSMPIYKDIANATHVRPLLNYCRSELKLYAEENRLSWQVDPSNMDTKFDRNYLRHSVIPVFEKRWSSYRKTILRSLEHQQECASLMREIGLEDFKNVSHKKQLSLNLLRNFSVTRQKNIIFIWLQKLELESPNSKHINQIISDLINSKSDNENCVNWKNIEVRKYKKLLYAFRRKHKNIDSINLKWEIPSPLKIMNETLIVKTEIGCGLSKKNIENKNISVQYRVGGEKLRLNNFSKSKTVKQLFQERGVLPWERDRFPMIYVNGMLVAIPGMCTDIGYLAADDEPSWKIVWSGYEKAVES
ncbi:MAG: tRNA lysidine(34) synthetase TilS [Legionellales bacterium]|nr:tRNA lysidine(34) synthetase TilS [Legionellales bacterium]